MDKRERTMTLQINETYVAEFIGIRPEIWGERWWKCGDVYIHPSEGMTNEQIIASFRDALLPQEAGE